MSPDGWNKTGDELHGSGSIAVACPPDGIAGFEVRPGDDAQARIGDRVGYRHRDAPSTLAAITMGAGSPDRRIAGPVVLTERSSGPPDRAPASATDRGFP